MGNIKKYMNMTSTVKDLREALKGAKGTDYVEIIMLSNNGGKWRIPLTSTRKEKGRFIIEINNPF